ncbi:DUF7168 domain-containing protein [Ectopseudomonas mendocina]|uniref:DUF7168 domain-containing protein n=1 Tax=Ectopseudomonas mendocina TaxID=300 RepID=UPI003F113B1D
MACCSRSRLSGYAYQVLERQLQKARREFLAWPKNKRCKRSTKVARGDHFANGWIDAVYHKVDEFAGVGVKLFGDQLDHVERVELKPGDKPGSMSRWQIVGREVQ